MVVQADPPHSAASGERLLEDLKPDPKAYIRSPNHRQPPTAFGTDNGRSAFVRELVFMPRSCHSLATHRTFGTKNAPLEMSHEPAVNAPDLIAAGLSSSNCR